MTSLPFVPSPTKEACVRASTIITSYLPRRQLIYGAPSSVLREALRATTWHLLSTLCHDKCGKLHRKCIWRVFAPRTIGKNTRVGLFCLFARCNYWAKKISPYVPKSSVVLSRYFFIVNMFLAAPANSGIWCFFFFAMSIIYHRLFSTSVPHFSAHHFTFFIGTPRLACHQLRVA